MIIRKITFKILPYLNDEYYEDVLMQMTIDNEKK